MVHLFTNAFWKIKQIWKKNKYYHFISNFRGGLNVLCFLLGYSPVSVITSYLPAYEDGTDRVFWNVGI
jgi:hypothetical protein